MRALSYHGPGRITWEPVADPEITHDLDAVIRVDTVTICGTDLHILKGDVPEVASGRILGHEAVGTVVETGRGVGTIHIGDRVLVSCITSCGRCRFCREGRYGQCLGGGGWILGHTIDGTQAEYVRVPFAENSTYPVPGDVTDEELLMLSDILPTGYEVGVRNGGVQPGDVVVGWARDITITTGLVDTSSTPTLLRLLAGGQIEAGRFVTHHFALEEFAEAYDVFGRAAETGALKVVLSSRS